MLLENRFFILLILAFCSSCATKQNILYLQDSDVANQTDLIYKEYEIKVDDILKIDISSENKEVSAVFNNNSLSENLNKESLLFNGYQVNSQGFIYLLSVGKVFVKGLTLSQLSLLLNKLLTERELITNPTIDIKILNSHFTVLGEVNKPGRYEFLSNNLNILEALGMAGDLTINGKRTDVKLIREYNGKQSIKKVDLTSTNFIQSNNYQIFSGDVILVNPNTTRVKNAGIIGNSGTLLSLLSFILSSIIIISR